MLFVFISCALVFSLHECLYEGVESPGTRVTYCCDLSCGCWGLNWSPLEEQPVLLTIGLSPQPPAKNFCGSNRNVLLFSNFFLEFLCSLNISLLLTVSNTITFIMVLFMSRNLLLKCEHIL